VSLGENQVKTVRNRVGVCLSRQRSKSSEVRWCRARHDDVAVYTWSLATVASDWHMEMNGSFRKVNPKANRLVCYY
jgi:hypothetical protein